MRINQQIFVKAAELLKQYGWCRGRFGSKDGKRCMMSAIYEAGYLLNNGTTEITVPRQLDIYVMKELKGQIPFVWNDQQLTIEPVLALLERLAGNPSTGTLSST